MVGRGEETFDEAFVGVGRAVGEKGGGLVGRGREADQIEADAAEERDAVRLGGGGDFFLFEAGEDEAVDGVAGPVGDLCRGDGGRGLRRGGNEGPVDVLLRFLVRRGQSALIDPRTDRRDLNVAERGLFVGHPRDVVVRAEDGLHHEAGGGVAGLEGAADVAALAEEGGGVGAHAALLLRGSVAFVAVRGEDGFHVVHVIHGRGGGRERSG